MVYKSFKILSPKQQTIQNTIKRWNKHSRKNVKDIKQYIENVKSVKEAKTSGEKLPGQVLSQELKSIFGINRASIKAENLVEKWLRADIDRLRKLNKSENNVIENIIEIYNCKFEQNALDESLDNIVTCIKNMEGFSQSLIVFFKLSKQNDNFKQTIKIKFEEKEKEEKERKEREEKEEKERKERKEREELDQYRKKKIATIEEEIKKSEKDEIDALNKDLELLKNGDYTTIKNYKEREEKEREEKERKEKEKEEKERKEREELDQYRKKEIGNINKKIKIAKLKGNKTKVEELSNDLNSLKSGDYDYIRGYRQKKRSTIWYELNKLGYITDENLTDADYKKLKKFIKKEKKKRRKRESGEIFESAENVYTEQTYNS